GRLPAGALQTRTDFGAPGYGGPCPPEGDHPHRYLFTVFAVKADTLDVKADTSAAVVGFNLHFNTLAKAEIMGTVQAVRGGQILLKLPGSSSRAS
ncbi:MAG TPA: YbhB/YbcL family Raf kinase inhibitor-like protein, partial [Bradyrhizobium sp.]|nr:YbhB/YbcL family Raf kinase inhibitor-like protein [Bradyrhizobium sp.]